MIHIYLYVCCHLANIEIPVCFRPSCIYRLHHCPFCLDLWWCEKICISVKKYIWEFLQRGDGEVIW